jgi:hypothetical protein
MAREKCGPLSVPRTIPIGWEANLLALTADSDIAYLLSLLHLLYTQLCYLSVTYSAWNSEDSYDTACEFFVVRFNGVTSLTS